METQSSIEESIQLAIAKKNGVQRRRLAAQFALKTAN
jgi:hypothetical protein